MKARDASDGKNDTTNKLMAANSISMGRMAHFPAAHQAQMTCSVKINSRSAGSCNPLANRMSVIVLISDPFASLMSYGWSSEEQNVVRSSGA
jgi:hypothetical protein